MNLEITITKRQCTDLNIGVISIRNNTVLVEGEIHLACECCEQQCRLTPRSIDLTPIHRRTRQSAQAEVVNGTKMAMTTVPNVECCVEHISFL